MLAFLQAASESLQDGMRVRETFLFLNLPELWVIGLVILPLTVAFAWWSYGGLSRLEPKTRVILASLRGLAIAICLFLLFQPAVERVRSTQIQSQVHVLVDDSASMQRRDNYPNEAQRASLEDALGSPDFTAHTRAQLVEKVLEKPDGLIAGLKESYDLRMFRFVRKPLPIRDLGELSSGGSRTQIGDALDLHLAAAGAVNLDAVILVSDGRNNAGLPPIEVAGKYKLADVPIYTIGVGDPNPPSNIRLIGPPGPKDALRLEEVVFDVTLEAEGLEGRQVTVTMHGARDGGSELPLASQLAALGGDHAPTKVRLFHSFEEAGDYRLRFEVSALEEETTVEDNQEYRFLRVNDEKIRVLFLDNLPRWDYRYLKNALGRVDPSIEYQAFLCDASGTFRQESSEGLPALRQIPRSREEIFQYHVILIGDLPPERIAATEEGVTNWLNLLVEFVEFGGGVGMLFGDAAMPERYRGTALEDLLPVILEDPLDLRSSQPDRSKGYIPRLENPEFPHEITRLLRDSASNRELWERGFQEFVVYYPVQQAKAGASVLLRHSEERNRFGRRVIAATSYYPRGNTFFLATDEMWRMRNPYQDRYLDRFWRNLVRHLASGRLRRRDDRTDLRLDKVSMDTGDQVLVSLQVRDIEFQPTIREEYPVFLRSAEGSAEKRLLRTVPGEPGSYQGNFTMDEPGTFSFLVFTNDNPADRILAREDLFVKIPDREMIDSSQDRESLEKIASSSKDGRYLFLGDAKDLLDDLSGRGAYEDEVDRSTRPIWDSFWGLFAILLVLAAEWVIRKQARLV